MRALLSAVKRLLADAAAPVLTRRGFAESLEGRRMLWDGVLVAEGDDQGGWDNYYMPGDVVLTSDVWLNRTQEPNTSFFMDIDALPPNTAVRVEI